MDDFIYQDSKSADKAHAQKIAKELEMMFKRKEPLETFVTFIHDCLPNISEEISGNGDSPLFLSMQADRQDVFEILLKMGADTRVKLNYGCSLIWTTLWEGNRQEYFFLLAPFSSVTEKEPEYKRTLLMQAVIESNLAAVKELLILGHNVHAEDKDGNTPLHFAMSKQKMTRDNKEIIELLLSYGADALTQNDMGASPEDILNGLIEPPPAIKQTISQKPANQAHKPAVKIPVGKKPKGMRPK